MICVYGAYICPPLTFTMVLLRTESLKPSFVRKFWPYFLALIFFSLFFFGLFNFFCCCCCSLKNRMPLNRVSKGVVKHKSSNFMYLTFMHTFILLHIKLMHVKSNIKFQTMALMPFNTHSLSHMMCNADAVWVRVFFSLLFTRHTYILCQCFTLSVRVWLVLTLKRAPSIPFHSSCVYVYVIYVFTQKPPPHTQTLTAFTLPMKNLCKFNVSKVRCFNLKFYLWLFCNRDKKKWKEVHTHTHTVSDRMMWVVWKVCCIVTYFKRKYLNFGSVFVLLLFFWECVFGVLLLFSITHYFLIFFPVESVVNVIFIVIIIIIIDSIAGSTAVVLLHSTSIVFFFQTTIFFSRRSLSFCMQLRLSLKCVYLWGCNLISSR